MQRVKLLVSGMLFVACLAGLSGCGGGIPSSPPLFGPTGIQGVTQEEIEGGAVPLTPRPPDIRPLGGATVVVQSVRGQEIARKASDSNGHFTFLLEPGTYVIGPLRPDPHNPLLPPSNQTVKVQEHHLTAVTLTYQLLAP